MFNLSRLIGLFLTTIDGWRSGEMDWVGCQLSRKLFVAFINCLDIFYMDYKHKMCVCTFKFSLRLVNTGGCKESSFESPCQNLFLLSFSLPECSQTVNWVKTHFSLFSALLTLLCDTFCWLKLNTDLGENLLRPSDTRAQSHRRGWWRAWDSV